MARRRTCGMCPKNDFGWRVVRAELRPGDAPACDYGRKQMRNAYMAGWMREHRKAGKGARHG